MKKYCKGLLKSLSARYKLFALLAGLLALNAGCELVRNNGEKEGEPVARIYDHYLYRSDIEDIVPKGLKGDDSISFVQNYINVWARNELMVYKAEYNLTEQEKRFEEKIEKYRQDLLKYAYLEKYIQENLDTNISAGAIRKYYNQNRDNFLLKENILKFRYLIVPTDAPELEEMAPLFFSQDSLDLLKLEEYALSYGRFFSFGDTAWVSFDRFNDLIPVQTYNQQKFLEENRNIKLENNGLLYLAEIEDYKIKDNSSPLPYVYELIKNILLNRKRLTLTEELEKNLLEDAIKKEAFETYP